jgi:preprotein translocase subunit SecE
VAKSATAKQSGENAIVRYFRETWFELKKVSWPTRQEALNLTGMVIVVAIFMAIILSLMDWVFSQLFLLILGIG